MKDAPLSTRLEYELDHLKSIFNEIGAYLFTKDLDGRYVYANQAVLDLFGCTLAELQGQDDSAFFDLDHSDTLQRHDRQVLTQQIEICQEEINYLKETGEKRIYWSVKKPMYGRNGALIGLCGISTDITEKKQIEAHLAEQHQLLEIILANVDAHIYMKDSQHRFLYVNQKVSDLLGLPAEQIINRRDDEVIPAASACQLWRLDNRVFETGELQAGEESLTDIEGNQQYYWSVKVPFLLADGTPTLIGISSDITELHQLKEQLHKQSVQDGLTGLYNRRFFFEVCEKKPEFECPPPRQIGTDGTGRGSVQVHQRSLWSPLGGQGADSSGQGDAIGAAQRRCASPHRRRRICHFAAQHQGVGGFVAGRKAVPTGDAKSVSPARWR